MSVTTIANRYGRALSDVVFSKGEQKVVQDELRGFVEMFESCPELKDVFANPTVSIQQQKGLLESLLQRTKPGTTAANFLRVLVQNYRLALLPEIYQAFARQVDEKMNIITAEVVTAGTISEDQKNILSQQLRKVTGKEVRLNFATDPSIIGGVVTRIGSQIYDGSIRNQLDMLRSRLSRE